jgi:hypothetical protein
VIKHVGAPTVVHWDTPDCIEKTIFNYACIKHRNATTMPVKDCAYIDIQVSTTVSVDHDAFHNDTILESTCMAQSKQKNGETTFDCLLITETVNFGNLYQVVYLLHPFMCVIHSAPNLGRPIFASTIVIAYFVWLILRFQNPFDPGKQTGNWLVQSAFARFWFVPCKPGGLQTFPRTTVTTAASTLLCLVVIVCTHGNHWHTLLSAPRTTVQQSDGISKIIPKMKLHHMEQGGPY